MQKWREQARTPCELKAGDQRTNSAFESQGETHPSSSRTGGANGDYSSLPGFLPGFKDDSSQAEEYKLAFRDPFSDHDRQVAKTCRSAKIVAIHRYIVRGDHRALRETLNKDPDLYGQYTQIFGRTPLAVAVLCSATNKLIEILLSAGDPNERMGPGIAAVHFAARCPDTRLLTVLVRFGADLRLHDFYDRSVAVYARTGRKSDDDKLCKVERFLQIIALKTNILLHRTEKPLRIYSWTSPILRIREKIRKDNETRQLQRVADLHFFGSKPIEKGFSDLIVLGPGQVGSVENDDLNLEIGKEFCVRRVKIFTTDDICCYKYSIAGTKLIDIDFMIRDFEFLRRLKNQHVLQTYGFIHDVSFMGFNPMYENIQTSLFHILHEAREELPLDKAREIGLQVLQGLIYLHDIGIWHCTLSSSAVFLTESGVWKIGNLEFAFTAPHVSIQPDGRISNDLCQLRFIPKQLYNWLAPEVLVCQAPHEATDMFSFCMVLAEMLLRMVPFGKQDFSTVLNEVRFRGRAWDVEKRLPPPFSDIFHAGSIMNPVDRNADYFEVHAILQAANLLNRSPSVSGGTKSSMSLESSIRKGVLRASASGLSRIDQDKPLEVDQQIRRLAGTPLSGPGRNDTSTTRPIRPTVGSARPAHGVQSLDRRSPLKSDNEISFDPKGSKYSRSPDCYSGFTRPYDTVDRQLTNLVDKQVKIPECKTRIKLDTQFSISKAAGEFHATPVRDQPGFQFALPESVSKSKWFNTASRNRAARQRCDQIFGVMPQQESSHRSGKDFPDRNPVFGRRKTYQVTSDVEEPQDGRKQDWYYELGGGCSRKESFAFKNSAWFGGAGSVRGLVRRYESQKDVERNNSAGQNASTESSHSSSVPLTSTSTALAKSPSSGQYEKRAVLSVKAPAHMPGDDSDYPLPPFPTVDLRSPSAPPLTGSADEEWFPPPPSLPQLYASRPLVAEKLPPPVINMPEKPPSLQWHKSGTSVGHMPPSHSTLPATRPTILNVKRTYSPPETYFTATAGEESSDTRQVASASENSQKSRMGDFRAVEEAVGQMSNRLQKRHSTSSQQRPFRAAVESTFRRNSTTKAREPPAAFGAFRHQQTAKSFMNGAHEKATDNLSEFHKQLDAILINSDKKVNYSRFEDPSPIHERAEQPFDQPDLIARTPRNVPTKPNKKEASVVELSGTRKTLNFGSESTSESSAGSNAQHQQVAVKNSIDLRQRQATDRVFDKHGKIIFQGDARRGFKFSSTISLCTSDLSNYTVTQTEKELRTGRSTTKSCQVYGSGVTQKIVIDRERNVYHHHHRGQERFDDSLESLSYDEYSES